MRRERGREGAVSMSRRPRLLTAQGTESERLHPESMSVDLQLDGVSSATMELAEDDATVRMHDFIEVYTPAGSAGIFRATNIADTKRGTRTVTLMHAIDTLSDSVWRGQTDYEGTVAGYLAAILAQQPVARWQLGTVANGTAEWKKAGINYDRLSELLEELRKDRFGYHFEYDFSTSPWTLSLAANANTVTSEFRLGRNVENCEITRDDAEMCNRLYLSVNHKDDTNGVTVTEEEIQVYNNTASQALYGIIEKTADIDLENVVSAASWAADFLAQRAHPIVQIVIDGYALKNITGETWDEARLGEMTRAALPDYAEALDERVVAVSYPELIFDDPEAIERVTVQMANHTEKFRETIANLQKETKKNGKAGRAGGRGGASAGELENWAIITKKHEEIMEGTELETLWESGMVVDATSGVTIYSLLEGFDSHTAQLSVNHEKIALLVNGQNQIRAAQIVASINDSGSLVHIAADKIRLSGGQTTVESLLSGAARVTSFQVGNFNQSSGGELILKGEKANWSAIEYVYKADITLPSITRSESRNFLYGTVTQPAGYETGRIVTSWTAGSVDVRKTTKYFLVQED